MMRWLPLLFLPVMAQAQTVQTNPNSYLVFPDLATAQARSAQQCVALGCKGGTTMWWNIVPLSDGTAAVEIQPSGDFAVSATKKGSTSGLTAQEQQSLKSSDKVTPATDAQPAAAVAK